jgi:hypothetical protein
MSARISPLLAALSLTIVGAASAAEIDMMIQNQYLGTDLTPVLTATTPAQANAEIVKALETVAASLPEARLARLAQLITDRSPHAVALNEAFVYECENVFPATEAGQGCDNPRIKGAFIDFLATTEANLAGRYVLKTHVQNFAVEDLAFLIDGVPVNLTVRDRDAIFVRSDVAGTAAAVDLGSSGLCRPSLDGEGCNYFAEPFTIETLLGELAIERGFVAVDLEVDEQPYRIFATHLEVRELIPGATESRALQRGQAAQLVTTAAMLAPLEPAGTKRLIVGDINSGPADALDFIEVAPGVSLPAPYWIFTSPTSGYVDTWTLRPGVGKGKGAPLVGFSCCQDADLGNHQSALYERIDMIFSHGQPAKVMEARLLGESVANKTLPRGLGVWPSDHASVAARIQY